MTFQVNKSPFAGQDGKFLTSRQIGERLEQELKHNVALRVEPTEDPDKFRVSGRGELHLSVLIETMRREGYELAVSRPEVIVHEEDGVKLEPWEQLTVDFEESYQGPVMTRVRLRAAATTGFESRLRPLCRRAGYRSDSAGPDRCEYAGRCRVRRRFGKKRKSIGVIWFSRTGTAKKTIGWRRRYYRFQWHRKSRNIRYALSKRSN